MPSKENDLAKDTYSGISSVRLQPVFCIFSHNASRLLKMRSDGPNGPF
jgi:hypothetical protein